MPAPDAHRYLHGHHDSVLRSHRWRTAQNSARYLLDRIGPSDEILDVGCGPGTITVGLAAAVPAGRVVGVDRSTDVLDEARAEATRLGCQNVAFEVGDVHRLPWADGGFDVVHAHQVLQHLADPVAALVEMRRVCRPGGRLAVREGDFGAMFWYPEDPEMEEWRALYRAVARAAGGEPDAARRLGSWVRAAGFGGIETSVSAWCYSGDQRAWWAGLWAERLARSTFAEQALGRGMATTDDLGRLGRAWLRWADHDDACFVIPSGEVLATA
jgi:ubiquinone/menaquinone biosynthesis C-methylase UbiE